MDKLRKFFVWFWHNKERVALALAGCVLLYTAYLVLNPPEPPNISDAPGPPRGQVEGSVPVDVGEPPSEPPRIQGAPVDYSELVVQNPFSVYARPPSSSARAGGPFDNVRVGGFRPLRDRTQVQVGVGRRSAWRNVGDTFDGFRITDIDGEDRTVTLYHEDSGREATLTGQ